MTDAVSYLAKDGVAVLQFGRPPTNALTADACAGLAAGLRRAETAKDVHAVLVVGGSDTFSAGHPLGVMTAESVAHVAAICRRFEVSALPSVAVLSGLALGAGLELALACHYRVASAKARVGFPDVGLGILSGAGGTQRAPRVVGAEATLQMMLSGAPMAVTGPAARPISDQIARGDVLEVAKAFAAQVIEKKLGPRPTCNRVDGFEDAAAFSAALSMWQARAPDHPYASNRDILECVEASRLLPFESGLEFERERFERRITAPSFRALRHIALAERRSSHFPELKDATAKPVKQIGVIGLGAVGSSFAAAALMAGFDVVVVERNASAQEQGMDRINQLLDTAVTEGRLSPVRRDGLDASLFTGNDLVAVAEAEFVLEASGKDAGVERQIFAQLDGISQEGAVLAAHGPSADIDGLAAQTGCPEEVMGLYFPTAAHVSPGVEVVIGSATSPETVVRALSVLRAMGKAPVRVQPLPGLIGHTVSSAALRASEQMVIQGADPYAIDRAMRAWGMSLGPFEAVDLAGLSAPWVEAAGAILSLSLAQSGTSGRSDGQGWYRYGDAGNGAAEVDIVHDVVAQARQEDGRAQRAFVDADIQLRCMAAMANAGVGLLRDGIVRTPADIDVALVHGFGFPRWRGGPMMAAQAEGLLHIRATLREMAAEGDSLSKPDPVFDHLIKNGGHLAR
ncbi:MAG: 3-hydroxyacyl-CoA dehydrogenase NAD-binding domain-containing protein [Shimia sp.]|uniref:3-hydroxyacyl-CoA dehydrogenase NAD-binding domain-containing protein n=1 Tax=Shimia sp. TaxID=1954381 RepID=UPI004058E244